MGMVMVISVFNLVYSQQSNPSTIRQPAETPITYLEARNHTKITPTESSTRSDNLKGDINLIIKGLIKCESGGNEKAIGDNGKAKGILQFHQGTFDKFGSFYNLPHDNIWDKDQQIAIAKRMIENGLIFHWRNCAKSLSLL